MATSDPTETHRRALSALLNSADFTREELEASVGTVWTTDELTRDFEVRGFLAPYVVVRRKSDGVVGSLMFTHRPRFYFSFTPDDRG